MLKYCWSVIQIVNFLKQLNRLGNVWFLLPPRSAYKENRLNGECNKSSLI